MVSEEIPDLYYFAGGEIIYRIVSVIILVKLIIQADPENRGNPPAHATNSNGGSTQMVVQPNS